MTRGDRISSNECKFFCELIRLMTTFSHIMASIIEIKTNLQKCWAWFSFNSKEVWPSTLSYRAFFEAIVINTQQDRFIHLYYACEVIELQRQATFGTDLALVNLLAAHCNFWWFHCDGWITLDNGFLAYRWTWFFPPWIKAIPHKVSPHPYKESKTKSYSLCFQA